MKIIFKEITSYFFKTSTDSTYPFVSVVIVFEKLTEDKNMNKILNINFITLIPYKLNYIILTNMAKI